MQLPVISPKDFDKEQEIINLSFLKMRIGINHLMNL